MVTGLAIMPKMRPKEDKRHKAADWSDLPAVLTLQEAADAVGVHLNTIRKLVDEGAIAHFKIGRAVKINKADLMRYAGLTPPQEE